jgi:hypothetical protein
MDILLIIALSMLTPFYFNVSNIDYKTSFGVSVSENDPEKKINSFKPETILYGNRTDTEVSSSNFDGPYSITYDMMLIYKVNLDFFNKRFWVGTRASWQPLQESISITYINPISPEIRPKTFQYYYNENPAFGMFVQFDILKPNPNFVVFPLSMSPYVGFNLLKVAYMGSGDYEQALQYTNTAKLFYGVSFASYSGWEVTFEGTYYKMDFVKVDSAIQDTSIYVNKYKLGIVYTFQSDIESKRLKKDMIYDDVIRILNPQIDQLIEEERMSSEELAKQEKERIKQEKEEEKRLKKEELEKAKIEEEQKKLAEQQAQRNQLNNRIQNSRSSSSSSQVDVGSSRLEEETSGWQF